MKLSQNNLYYLSQCAISAALQAGDIIRHHTNKHFSYRLKQGADSLAAKIVTEVDFLAQEKILKSLSQSCQV